jgi:uncharacterized UPF0160 family protein
MKIVTHNGHFHTDDLLAVAVLTLKYPEAEVVRTRDHELIKSADIAVDVGQVYDPEVLRFDHHQSLSAGIRSSGIPYASLGLVWKKYGEELCGSVEAARLIEDKLVVPVDALDNGVDLCAPTYEGVHEYRIGDYFETFAAQAETMEDYDRIFYEVLEYAKGLLKREITTARKTVSDWAETLKIYEESENKHLVVLPHHARWKGVLVPTEAIYVVYPRPDGKWAAQTVPKRFNSFESKKDFPHAWAGLIDGELARVSGVPGACFCHRDRFLVVALTKEAAVELAEKSLNS